MEPVNRPYEYIRDRINIHDLNLKKKSIQHQGPHNKIQVPTNRNKPDKKKKINDTGSTRK